MTENIIYYGPPGTGKTYFIQNLQTNYIDYTISDQQIKDAYVHRSVDWLLIALIIFQNRGKMRPADIVLTHKYQCIFRTGNTSH